MRAREAGVTMGESLMDEKTATLRARLDDFSRRLDASTREFETTGELTERQASVRKRSEAIKAELDRAIQAGNVSDILRLEFERDLNALLDDFSRMEKEFDAAAMKESTLISITGSAAENNAAETIKRDSEIDSADHCHC